MNKKYYHSWLLIFYIIFAINGTVFAQVDESTEQIAEDVVDNKSINKNTTSAQNIEDETEKNEQTEKIEQNTKDNSTIEKIKKNNAKKTKTNVVNSKPLQRRNNLSLLELKNSTIKEKRIPGIKTGQKEIVIKEDIKKSQAIEENVSEIKKEQAKDNEIGFLFFNKENNKFIPYIFVVLVVLLLILHKLNSKKKRKRIFRRIPKR